MPSLLTCMLPINVSFVTDLGQTLVPAHGPGPIEGIIERLGFYQNDKSEPCGRGYIGWVVNCHHEYKSYWALDNNKITDTAMCVDKEGVNPLLCSLHKQPLTLPLIEL